MDGGWSAITRGGANRGRDRERMGFGVAAGMEAGVSILMEIGALIGRGMDSIGSIPADPGDRCERDGKAPRVGNGATFFVYHLKFSNNGSV